MRRAFPATPGLLCLLASTAALWPVPGRAADYEPPAVVDAPEYTPVEVGSGWYLRGDVGYEVDDGFGGKDGGEEHVGFGDGLASVAYDEDDDKFSGSLGIGYHFADWLRGDLNLGYIRGNEIEAGYDDGTITAFGTLSNEAWYGMANLYADLGTYAGFTPYVGAGAGVLRSKYEASGSYDDGTTVLKAGIDERQYSFAYALNAGIAYNVTSNIAVDVGYQYLNAPDAKFVRVDNLIDDPVKEGVDFQQVRIGLRFDTW